MNQLNILSGGAAQGLVGSLAAAFKAETGFDIAGEFGAVGAMANKLREGIPSDMVILTGALLATLADERLVDVASIANIGLVETALAVRAGDPEVAAQDEPALRKALLTSDAIFVPDTKASTAGIHVAKVLAKLGVSEAVAARLRVFPNGATAMHELAASDAQRPIGCTQSTEIILSKGVVLSGSLPPGCELATMYTAGITAKAAHPSQASALIGLLVGAGQRELRERAGFIGARK